MIAFQRLVFNYTTTYISLPPV